MVKSRPGLVPTFDVNREKEKEKEEEEKEEEEVSRKSVTISGRRSISEPSTPHIGKGVALVAQAATLVYI
jgi:hypothetical protein